MRRLILALAAAAPLAIATPAVAQSRADQARWDAAQQRYQQETERYYAERDIYFGARSYRRGAPGGQGYGYNDRNDDRYENGYDPSRYYRDGQGYQERPLSADERVYAGNDGKYYCKRSDGTTGLIVGGAAGGVLGNVIDGGHSRTAGTLIGAAIGALAGKAVDQQNSQQQLRCR
jgi:hypothetical protein